MENVLRQMVFVIGMNNPFIVCDLICRDCNQTHFATSGSASIKVGEKLPQLFQSHVICAGSDVGAQGSCTGDSGGPLMFLNREEHKCRLG